MSPDRPTSDEGGAGSPHTDIRRLAEAAADVAGRQRDRILATIARLEAEGWPEEEARRAWLELLAGMGREHAAFRQAMNRVSPRIGLPNSAQQRMLTYLRFHVGEVIDGDALAGVAGISAWARRIRELRVEHGWPISSKDADAIDLAVGQYRLEADHPDERSGEAWQIANRIRNMKGKGGRRLGGGQRLIEFFKANVGEKVTKEQLAYVSHPIQTHARRIRELTEQGWQIESHLDRGLKPGEYVLASTDRLDAKARRPVKLRYRLIDEAGWRCRMCGSSPEDRTVRLQVHHKLAVHRGGDNGEGNLLVLCDSCHAGEHATDKGIVADELLHPERERDYT